MKDFYAKQLFKFIHRKSKYPIDPYAIYSFLMKSQYYSREEIKLYQLEKINFLLSCANYVPHYTLNKFPAKLTSIDEVLHLPEISRSDYQKAPSSFINSSYKIKTFTHKTSGSSGIPMSVAISSEAETYRIAGRLRFKNWYGLNYADNGVTFWGRAVQNLQKKGIVYNKLKNIFAAESMFVSVFSLSTLSIKNI